MSVIYTSLDTPSPQFAVSSSRTDVGIGIDLPIGKSNDGIFFKQTFTTLSAAKANIKNLILTMRGERIMHPTLGTGVWNSIMEPMQGTDFEHEISATIRENVAIWLPYINLSKLNVKANYDNNSVEISMNISLKSDPQTIETIHFSISKGDI